MRILRVWFFPLLIVILTFASVTGPPHAWATEPSYPLTAEIAAPQGDCGMVIEGATVYSEWCTTSCMTGIDCDGNVCIVCVQMCLLDEGTGAISLEEFTLGDC
jgi:hypothetical protein